MEPCRPVYFEMRDRKDPKAWALTNRSSVMVAAWSLAGQLKAELQAESVRDLVKRIGPVNCDV